MPLILLRLSEDHVILATGHELANAYVPNFQRLVGRGHLTVLGYTNALGTYIGTQRMCKEGGYEGDWSCFYYGLPMPLHPSVERGIVQAVGKLILPGSRRGVNRSR